MKQISIPNNGFRGTYSVLSEGSLLNLGAFGIIHWDIHTYIQSSVFNGVLVVELLIELIGRSKICHFNVLYN